MRRSDRSGAPLSLVLCRICSANRHDPSEVVALADEALDAARETDFVGLAGDGLVGVILTHTDTRGLEAFLARLRSRADATSVCVEGATYPTDVFGRLVDECQAAAVALPFFLDRAESHGKAALLAKRLLDVLGATALLVALSPLMLAIALAVRLSSPGPVIYCQQRIGRGGARFAFYKFRSMRVDTDDSVHREYIARLIEGRHDTVNQGDDAQPHYKLKFDPRVTGIGRLIRKTSMDELPQLWNVLKGDMSLVGPRPPIPYEVEKYHPWHLRRVLEARPGITGLWQVEGRSRVSFDEMVRMDLRYVRDWSLWLDIRILVRTVGAVLRLDGHG